MMTFYREWLPLAKSDFRILALLADKAMHENAILRLDDKYKVPYEPLRSK